MAVKSLGALSLTTDIVGEFGGVAPHSLSEYYGGGTYVPAGANPGIATSGQINMGSHYGAVAVTVLTISSNTNNYDIGAAAIAAGGDKSTPVILTINSGVTVGSTSSSTPAMYTGTGWSSGTTITITNNGSIVGKAGEAGDGLSVAAGGNGGRGGSCSGGAGSSGGAGATGSGSADAAQNGGDAFSHSQFDTNMSVVFITAGTRTAGAAASKVLRGAGGGGGGGGHSYRGGYDSSADGGNGGGGGRGNPGGSGGAGGGYCSSGSYGVAGASGTTSAGGVGGSGGAGGSGGNGGGLNSAGGSGTTRRTAGGAGGAGGGNRLASGTAGKVLAGNTAQIS